MIGLIIYFSFLAWIVFINADEFYQFYKGGK